MKTAEEKLLHAKDLALKALGARDLTRRELSELLLQKRVASVFVESALLELECLGIIDDRRVAQEHVHRRLGDAPTARSLLEAELLERGIDAGMAQSVLDELLSGMDDSAELLELARDRIRRSPARLAPDAIRRRAFAFLVRRGFDEDLAQQAVEQAAEEYLGRP